MTFKRKIPKDQSLPTLPSLYTLLPTSNSFDFNPYLPLPTSNSSTKTTTESNIAKKQLEEVNWWFQEGCDIVDNFASTSELTLDHPFPLPLLSNNNQRISGGVEEEGDGAKGVLKKILELERDEEEIERKLEWKRFKRRERWRVEERYRKLDEEKLKKTKSKNGIDLKGKGKEVEGDREETIETDNSIGHESASESSSSELLVPSGSGSTNQRRRKKKKSKESRTNKKIFQQGQRPKFLQRPLAEFEIPELDEEQVLNALPSSDLLLSLHHYIATSLSNSPSYPLLPPLTLLNPYPPQDQLNHFNSLLSKSHEEESIKSLTYSQSEWNSYLSTKRELERDKGLEKNVWKNLERSFEGDLLVSLGVLVELLVEEDGLKKVKEDREEMERMGREVREGGSGSLGIEETVVLEEEENQEMEIEMGEEEKKKLEKKDRLLKERQKKAKVLIEKKAREKMLRTARKEKEKEKEEQIRIEKELRGENGYDEDSDQEEDKQKNNKKKKKKKSNLDNLREGNPFHEETTRANARKRVFISSEFINDSDEEL